MSCFIQNVATSNMTAAGCPTLPSYIEYIFYEKSFTSLAMLDTGIWLVVFGVLLILALELDAMMSYMSGGNSSGDYKRLLPDSDKVPMKVPMNNVMLGKGNTMYGGNRVLHHV